MPNTLRRRCCRVVYRATRLRGRPGRRRLGITGLGSGRDAGERWILSLPFAVSNARRHFTEALRARMAPVDVGPKRLDIRDHPGRGPSAPQHPHFGRSRSSPSHGSSANHQPRRRSWSCLSPSRADPVREHVDQFDGDTFGPHHTDYPGEKPTGVRRRRIPHERTLEQDHRQPREPRRGNLQRPTPTHDRKSTTDVTPSGTYGFRWVIHSFD